VVTVRRIGCVFLVAAGAFAWAATPPKPSDGAPAAHAPVVVTEDAVAAFFDDLDRQATTFVVRDEESPAQVPSFPKRDELHARMKTRLPEIDRLRARLLAGETRRGFLEARANLSNSDEALLVEENGDRLAVYEAIAAQAKTKIDEGSRARASQITLHCKRGVWLQNPGGDWGQKT